MLAILSVMLLAMDERADSRLDRNACGLNSLALINTFLGASEGRGQLERLLPMSRAPFSYRDVEGAARHVGRKTYLVHWGSKSSATFACPAILHIRANQPTGPPDHFLACFGETAEGLVVAEFPHPPFILPRSKLEPLWDGDVLYVENPQGTVIDGLRRRVLVDRICRITTYVLAGTLALLALLSWRPWARWRGARRVDQAALA